MVRVGNTLNTVFYLWPGLVPLGSKQILNIESIAVRAEPWLERIYIPFCIES